MAQYIITGNYTSAAIKGLIAHPSDREAAARALIEGSGGKLLSFYVTTGEFDFLMVVEADDLSGVMSGTMVASATGAVSNFKTVQAFTAAEFMAAQKAAGALASRYQQPN